MQSKTGIKGHSCKDCMSETEYFPDRVSGQEARCENHTIIMMMMDEL